MRGVSGLDLRTGQYTITPAMDLREAGRTLRDLAGGGGTETHLYDVERPDGTTELEIVKRLDPQGDGLVNSVEERVQFGPPEGDPVLSVERGGFRSPWTLREAGSDEVLATWRKSLFGLGSWKLADPAGEVVATVSRSRSLGNLLSFSRHGTYSVSAPDGTTVARFDHVRADGGLATAGSSELDVRLERSSIPPEVLLALGYGVYAKAAGGSGGGGGE